GPQERRRQFPQRPRLGGEAPRHQARRRPDRPRRDDHRPPTRYPVLGRQQRRHRQGPHDLRQDRRGRLLRADQPGEAEDQRLPAGRLPDRRRQGVADEPPRIVWLDDRAVADRPPRRRGPPGPGARPTLGPGRRL
ncbi:MAG: LSU ribosomal protein L27p, partial [uncultured Thermomicrobiales bacterium]